MPVLLDAALIRRAAKISGAVAAFPFLRPFSKKVRPGCCGRAVAGPDPRTAIAAVGRLSPARLTEFKELVGTDRLTAWVVRAAKVTKVEF